MAKRKALYITASDTSQKILASDDAEKIMKVLFDLQQLTI